MSQNPHHVLQRQLDELKQRKAALNFVVEARGLPIETRQKLRHRILATQVQIDRLQRRIDRPHLRILGKA